MTLRMDLVNLEDRILGGLYGLLIGDAVGVPYEFSSANRLPPLEEIDLRPPLGFQRAHAHAPKGAWSDDGAQALCLLASLLHCKQLDLHDFSRRLLSWFEHGYMAVDNVVFDVGIQTSRALRAILGGTPVERAAPAEEMNNGNGSLMRVLPLALWHTGSDEQLIEDAAGQSIPTHAHARSQVCCALYCLWARGTLEARTDAWARATETLRRYCQTNAIFRAELEEHVQPDAPAAGKGSGYVVDCLHSARLALEEPTFERVVQRAIAFGNDTDTTAAVAGGIAGLRHGMSAIPERWLAGLNGRSTVDPIAAELLEDLRKRAGERSALSCSAASRRSP
jgi:ADP-ribosylglycohydrolase